VSKVAVLGEFMRFMGRRKRYWITPIFAVLILFGALLVFTEGSALAPFIYTLF
jgi:hypothetical protein